MIRLDARRLSDEVAQWFNLAKIKKVLSSKMNLLFRRIAGCPQHLPSPAGPRHFHMLLVALAVVESWHLLA